MAKKVSPAQAKAAKQKKIAIVLSVLFVIVAAIQGPRMLKMLKGPSVPVAAATEASTPAPEATATATTPTALAPAGAPPEAGQPAVLASSDGASEDLLSFELFESKDPFTQQVDAEAQAASAVATDPAEQTSAAPAASSPPASSGSAVSGAGAEAEDGGGTAPATPFAPTAPAAEAAAATTISVNGVSGQADVGKEFPTDDPIFVLVSTARNGKSAQIGIAGGSYAERRADDHAQAGQAPDAAEHGRRHALRARPQDRRGLRAGVEEVIARIRSEEGFGLIELMISIVVLNVALLAIFAAFNSGALAIARASQTSTASVLADKQMELYRAVLYANVALDSTALTAAASDSIYTGDSAYSGTQTSKSCGGSPPAECSPRQTVTGPDGNSYRVDTYIVAETPTNGRAVKRVTVVVRRSGASKTLARLTSTFDASTG